MPESFPDPEAWAKAHAGYGFSAAGLPLEGAAPDELVDEYSAAAHAWNIQIAEVGAWSNPLSRDAAEAKAAIEHCQQGLAVAERAGARCCVNIAGSVGPTWAGPCAEDLLQDTEALIVDTVREIIDAVRPTRTFYALEAMPWLYPDSAESYERLLAAIDRPAFAVHLDPVNLISSPRLFFENRTLIEDFVRRLGPHIRSCHAKDISLSEDLTVHLDEVRPGTGALDYRAFVSAVEALDPQLALLVEHLSAREDCLAATDHIRSVCEQASVKLIEPGPAAPRGER